MLTWPILISGPFTDKSVWGLFAKKKQNNEQNKPMSAICVINMVYLLIQTGCIYRKYFSLCEIYRWNALKML